MPVRRGAGGRLCAGSSRRTITSGLGVPGGRGGEEGPTPGPLFRVQAKLVLAPVRRRRRRRAPPGCRSARRSRAGDVPPRVSPRDDVTSTLLPPRRQQGGPTPAHLARAAPSPLSLPPPRRRRALPRGLLPPPPRLGSDVTGAEGGEVLGGRRRFRGAQARPFVTSRGAGRTWPGGGVAGGPRAPSQPRQPVAAAAASAPRRHRRPLPKTKMGRRRGGKEDGGWGEEGLNKSAATKL